MNTDDSEVQAAVGKCYLALADLLAGFTAQRWNAASLCEGWGVREVVAHVTMPARYSEEAFMAELGEDEFDFGRLSNRIAARDAQLPVDQLVANLRDEALHNWMPPGGGARGALSHVVIHGVDITVPLGEKRTAPDSAVRVVLDDLAQGGATEHFGVNIAGRSLEATDISWSYGQGPGLRSDAGKLVAHLSGRSVGLDQAN